MGAGRELKELYSEMEAAKALGISLERLRQLLDQNVFTDGSPRPPEITLQRSDLVLIEFWNRTTPNPKVVRMTKRH